MPFLGIQFVHLKPLPCHLLRMKVLPKVQIPRHHFRCQGGGLGPY